MDVIDHNRRAWDRRVARGNRWTVPVTPEDVDRARRGDIDILLVPEPVPRAWYGELAGKRVLGLAAAGGQQCPLLAAAGADVTVFDLSPAQLERDREVARREGLAIETVEGEMSDLSAFADASFELIVHPVANLYVADVRPVWPECYRVLAPGGALLAGFYNPIMCVFDDELYDDGVLQVRYPVPYSDVASLTDAERAEIIEAGEPLAFGHSLSDQIGGQLDAGFVLAGFFECGRGAGQLPDRFIPPYIATRAVKL